MKEPSRKPFLANLPWLIAIVAVMLVLTAYAIDLNRDYYRVRAPFFDSCVYMTELNDLACVVLRDGFESGIRKSLQANVALPWLEMAVLARVVHPSRALGVCLQAFWLGVLALSIFWYLARYRGARAWVAFALTIPFVSFTEIYYFNGGLADFRMDLSLYIFTSLCAVWYLATYETESKIPWLASGIAAMLACLARATAPVYLLAMIGPLLAIRFVTSRGRRKELLVNCAWMCFPVLLSVAGYLMYNFHNLYFYYVTWSPDANAHLPLSESYRHLLMPYWHIGEALAICCAAALVLNLAAGAIIGGLATLRRIDWKILWLAAASPLFLVLRGAGVNPFVTMPAVFGCLLFSFFTFRGTPPLLTKTWACALIAILAVAPCIVNASEPKLRPYTGDYQTRMAGFKGVIQEIDRNASRAGLRDAKFVAPEIGDFNCSALENVMIYEFGALCSLQGKVDKGECGHSRTLSDGVTLKFEHHAMFTASDELLWKLNVPGSTEAEKMNSLVATAGEADYLLLPDEKTLTWLEHNRQFNYINLKNRELKQRLLGTGVWKELGSGYRVSDNETIEVYGRRAE